MKKITLNLKGRSFAFILFTLLFALLNVFNASAQNQNFCNNEVTLWSEDFGTGTGSVSNTDIVNLSYQATGILNLPGTYRVIDFGDQDPNWHKTPDHTPNDVNGRMAVINAKAGVIYGKTISSNIGFTAGFYSFHYFLVNLNGLGNCGPNSELPVMTVMVEYKDANGNWVAMTNSPVTSAPVPETNDAVWVHLGGIFTLPATGNFLVTNVRILLIDETAGGCGNDLAIDDLKFSACSDDGPLPVRFINVTAQKKGSGVNISWSTITEDNNDYFQVEKSNDGGQTWSAVNRTGGSGNSSVTKNYTSYDAKPSAGANYYRVKQVDKDGTARYSQIVLYKLTIANTDVSVLANPFNNNITIDFLSDRSKLVNARIFDNTGKQVIVQQMNIEKGSSRKYLPAMNLSKGIYFIQIVDDNGSVIYKEKLIKQ